MPQKMYRTQVNLTEKQVEALKVISEETGKSRSRLLREVVCSMIEEHLCRRAKKPIKASHMLP
jgi:metal-responsive CopG/Arc/MetJ family transcriptional regulator